MNPQVVAALGSEIYVAWISGAFEEFAGNLTLASSSDGGDTFDLMTVDVGNNATYVATAARSGGSLYLAWQQHSLHDVTEGNDDTNMFLQHLAATTCKCCWKKQMMVCGE